MLINKLTLVTLSVAMVALGANAQLYSSGNILIGGNSVGIGINTPLASLHIKETLSGPAMGNAGNSNTNTSNGFHPMLRFHSQSSSNHYYWDVVSDGTHALKIKYKQGNGTYSSKFTLSPTTLYLQTDNIKHNAFEIGSSPTPSGANGQYLALGMKHQGGHVWSGKGAAIMTGTNGSLYMIANNKSALNSTQDLAEQSAVELKGDGVLKVKHQLQVGSIEIPTGAIASFSGGHVYSEKYICKSSGNWPDYVFDDKYALIPLEDVAKYVEAHKHLPGVPSAQEVNQSGVDLEEMNKLLLKKVEELTLYLIEMQQELNALKEE